MHIPDGFLDAKTALATTALSVTSVGFALRHVQRGLPPRRVPLLGLAAAFLFAAQMVNFPVLGGTSGHLIGGALVAALLGPSAAVIVVTTVLIVQCLAFADGGITALGANVFNMGVIATTGGALVFQLTSRAQPGLRGRVAGAAFAGWCSSVLAALACAGELATSGTVAPQVVFPAMTGIHVLIGIGEGLLTALIYAAVARTRPELVSGATRAEARGSVTEFVVFGLLAAVGVALFLAPFASTQPDGLESVAARLGFEQRATALLAVPAADYQVGGIGHTGLSTAMAGLVGTLLVFGLAQLLGRAVVSARHNSESDA